MHGYLDYMHMILTCTWMLILQITIESGNICSKGDMSRRVFNQIRHMEQNLLIFMTDATSDPNHGFEPLIYKVLGNCSVFIRSTYKLDSHRILVDISCPKDLLLVQTILCYSGQSWQFRNGLYKLDIKRAIHVIGYSKVIQYACYIENGILPQQSSFTSWMFKFNFFHGAPMGCISFTPLQLATRNNFLAPY